MNPIDLTLPISRSLPAFPGSPVTQFIPWAEIEKHGYNLELLFLSSHSGTHIDAPFHFIKGGSKVHEISPKRLISNANRIKIKKKPDQLISKSDIINFEREFGKIPKFSAIIFETGWQVNLKKSYFFTKNPGLSLSAAKYLVRKKINLVGIDTPSIDRGKNFKFSVHKVLLKNNVLIVENLCNLEKIPKNQFKLIVLPLKLLNATGSPVRAIAL